MIKAQELMYWFKGPHKTGTSIDPIRWNCHCDSSLGIDEIPEWQDWSERSTTLDQKRIEDILDTENPKGKRLLHIGTGNSGLAARFHLRFETIHGITIQPSEIRKAERLSIPGYQVKLVSKYSSGLCKILGTQYDYIIDNNPSSFACCRMHFFVMMRNYQRLLALGGVILTDQQGLGWATTKNDPRWKLTRDEWYMIGKLFDLEGQDKSKTVFSLQPRS